MASVRSSGSTTYTNRGDTRATKWSVTINLKSVSRETAEECIARARQRDWRVVGQLEQGEQGTEHYQLAVATPQIRFTAVKKVFPTAHIEVAKDWHALLAYCQKEDTRKETLKNVKTGYISWSQLRNMFFEWVIANDRQIVSFSIENYHMRQWDEFVGEAIERGYEVDYMGVNPNYRSCIQRYWDSYIRRQTDRQTTPNIVVPTISQQDGMEEERSTSEEGSEDDASSWGTDESPF